MRTYPVPAPQMAAWRSRTPGELLAASAADRSFLPVRSVFALRPSDVPTLCPEVEVLALDARRIGVIDRVRGAAGTQEDVNAELVLDLLSRVDGRSTLESILDGTRPGSRASGREILTCLLGAALVVPDAVEALEARIRHEEIVRFPAQSPYAVHRAYWENAADVREALPALYRAAGSADEFSYELSRLHALALLGTSGRSHHGGPGEEALVPGRYRGTEARVHRSHPALPRFLDEGVRAFGLEPAGADDREVSRSGVGSLGWIEEAGVAYRLAPASRALLWRGLDALRHRLTRLRAAAAARDRGAVLVAAARFHGLFCCFHPFPRVNNSLAMNVVNHALAGVGIGRLPHLFLDHLALRMDEEGYAPVFRAIAELAALRDDEEDAAARGWASRLLQEFRRRLPDGAPGPAGRPERPAQDRDSA